MTASVPPATLIEPFCLWGSAHPAGGVARVPVPGDLAPPAGTYHGTWAACREPDALLEQRSQGPAHAAVLVVPQSSGRAGVEVAVEVEPTDAGSPSGQVVLRFTAWLGQTLPTDTGFW